jgi:Pyruvate/2-oxoacid:ferredoxin oxidoreductase delta subunit
MSEPERTLHYVCTHQDARELVERQKRFWVQNCGCRERRGNCDRSRMDVCLQFRETTAAGGSNQREITRAEAEEILREATAKHLVTRPFRDETTRTVTEGICFCCNDCCEYFKNREERCDKGAWIESTDEGRCDGCGVCAPFCYFGARVMDGDEVVVNRRECYGCGLCAELCPQECVDMVPRGSN